jgi:3-(3-hydroxy-phenyl)propionate hydroxylase
MTGAAGYTLPVYPYRRPPELAEQRIGRHPVVIVGGGLTGLAAACDLAERGVSAVLLDEDDTVGVRGLASRGIAVARRTLEIFDRLGLWPRFAEKGVRWSVGRVRSGAQELYRFDLAPDRATAQPAFVNLQQFHTEAFLVDRIGALGRTDLRWKNRVVGVDPGEDSVLLTVETPDGRYAIDAEYVIAADGAHSTVRGLLGLDPPAETREDRWCISDVRIAADLPNERWIWIEAPFNENRGVWRHPMADGVWRMDFQVAPDADPASVADPEATRRRVAAALGPGVGFDLVWVGAWQYRTFALDRFRHGRVFFVGDAAHVMNPFGGRGGNSGVQDAENLAWKLALVLAGRAPAALLDSYDAERRPAALHNITLTRRTARFLSPRPGTEQEFRRAVLDLAPGLAFARALVNGGRLSDAFVYADSPLTSSGGQAAPNVALVGADGAETTLAALMRDGARFLALHAAPAGADPAPWRALQAAYPLTYLRLGPGGLADPGGALAGTLGLGPGGLAVLRPDQHMAALLPAPTPALVAAALDRALGR